MGSHVPHRRPAVLHTIEHRCSRARLDQPIFNGDRDQAKLGEVRGKRVLAARLQTSPTAPVNREKASSTIGALESLWLENVQKQLAITNLLVNHDACGLEFRSKLANVVKCSGGLCFHDGCYDDTEQKGNP
jgi:hypothetical protein